MRAELKTIGVAAMTHNHYTTRPISFEWLWQTDPFIWIASG